MKHRTGQEPDKYDKHRCAKCPCAAEHDGGAVRENAEHITDDAKEIAFLLVLFWFCRLDFVHDSPLTFRV
jgi:hypothetical protein